MQTVLVIDDDPSILDVLAEFLTAKGWGVSTAMGGREGLEAFSTQGADVVLCDLNMPDLGGLEVLAAVKRQAPLTPFVVVSGTADVETAVEALKQGAWDYLLKPLLDLNLLPPLLERLEERAQLLEANQRYQADLEAEVRQRTAELVCQLKEKDLLLAEVHHRVKNNLQVIQILLGLQHDHSSSPDARASMVDTLNRIQALAMVQEAMHGTHATQIDTKAYLTGLLHYLLSATNQTFGLELSLEVEPILLPVGLAFTFGLVVTEMVSGLGLQGPPTEPWSLAVKVKGGDGVVVEMVDSRDGWAKWLPGPGQTALGWELVTALASQQGGALEWDPTEPRTLRATLR